MCGIAGQIILDDRCVREEGCRDMLAEIKRSGSDREGMYIRGEAAMIHAGPAVVDIENGSQPMEFLDENEHYILAYNGELYNTPELRRELESLGHRFRTRSDTEVLGRAYVQWGRRCVEHFNGIFAFAVWESCAKRLFLARDRIGVKPLFYTLKENSLIFASTLQILLTHPDVEAVIDSGGIAELLFMGPGRTPGCGVLRDIEELEPGFIAEYDSEGFRKWRYWDLVDTECTDSFAYAAEKTRCLVLDAIERQLVSDVPVCTLLSGGLDSSIISSVAGKHMAERGDKLRTFSVGYRDNAKHFKAGKFQPDSDEMYVKIMSDFLGAEHHDVILDTKELVPAIYDAVLARGLPGMADVDSSLLLFFRAIKKHATVALSGECADEIFGGYPWYRDREIRERYGFPWAQSTERRQAMLRDEFKIDGAEYIDARYRKTLSETSVAPSNSDERRMKEMVNLNFKWFMQTLIDRTDRMARYTGVEARMPLCDYRIAEYLYTIPWSYKDYNNMEKGLLREAMRGILPDEVLWRKKSPYPKTHNPSYMRAVSKHMRGVLEDESSPVLRIVKKEALEKLLTEYEPVPWYGQLMTTPQTIAYFLQMNFWLKHFDVRIVK